MATSASLPGRERSLLPCRLEAARAGACATLLRRGRWIANGAGAGNLQRGQHHVRQLVFVFGGHDNDVGDIAEIADIEESVMGGAVVAGEAGAVHAEDNRELLQADIVNDGIERALQERRVNGADRLKSLRSEAGGEDDRVLLGDAHVEVPFGMMRAEKIKRRAVGHGRGDGDNFFVFVGELDEGICEDLRVSDLAGGLGFAGFGVVRSETVELFLLVYRGLIALALFA